MNGEGDRPFFEAIARRYDRAYALPSDETRRRMKLVLAALPASPARVLDLGVGTGRELPALLDAGHRPTGVDGSPAMLELCARRARPIPLVLADFWSPLPFPDASFDAALALHGTLAHPPSEQAVARLAKEVARLVLRGGVWIVETPSEAWLDEVEALAPSEGRVRRTGPRTFVYEDRVTRAAIAGRVLSDEQWRDALAPGWNVAIEPLGTLERRIVARRG